MLIARHTSHQASHITHHITHYTSHITHHTSHITHHTSHITHHALHITHHASQITHHASRITHHASRITHHTSHITHHTRCERTTGACVLPLVSVGIMDASATRSRRTPKTRKRWSTTADGSNGREKGDRTENVARDTGPPPLPLGARITACYAHFGSSNRVINCQCHETAGVIRSNTVV